jgi:DNA-binding transcriptional regulator YiaG
MKPDQILKLRESFGESQSKFGERIGVRQATIADWETGKCKPSRMAEILLRLISQHKK